MAESSFKFVHNSSTSVKLTQRVAIALKVTDSLTGTPLQGARCTILSSTLTSDAAGSIWVSSAQDARLQPDVELQISAKINGYAAVTLSHVLTPGENSANIALNPDVLSCFDV